MATSLRKAPAGPDSTTVKFLFAVIKQLETKSVNWQTVADEIGITNGHAARMRFSRLKAQVEGTAPYGKAQKMAGDIAARKKRKTDIRTERKRAAELLAAGLGTTDNDTEDSGIKMDYEDNDMDAHADDEREDCAGGNAEEMLQQATVKMEPGFENISAWQGGSADQ